jgi:hypothetical protein
MTEKPQEPYEQPEDDDGEHEVGQSARGGLRALAVEASSQVR